MKKNLRFVGIWALVVLLPLMFFTLSFKDTNGKDVSSYEIRSAYKGVVVLKPKQSHFVVTSDYEKAVGLLKKGYVLEDVDISKGAYTPPVKHYTLVKYSN